MSAKSLNAHKECYVLINHELICMQKAMLSGGEHQCNQILGCFPILAKSLCVWTKLNETRGFKDKLLTASQQSGYI